jgi:hypothetical protein
MKKRTKGDTAKAAVDAMVNAAKPLHDPPAHCLMRDGDRPFWDDIVRARAREEWTETDLVVAAQLARCQADIERESMRLDDEGSVGTNHRGSAVMNPRVSVLEQLARREMALMRTLRMGGRVVGDSRDMAGTRKAERQARATAEAIRSERDEDDEESLLATP